MSIVIDGLTLTQDQLGKLKDLFDTPEVAAARRAITLYKKEDEGLAYFRTQAGNLIVDITARAVLNRPLRKEQARFVNQWLVDGNPMFREYFAALNKTLGRRYIQGV